MEEKLVYLDSFAIVKLVLPEEESPVLTALLPDLGAVVSSALAAVEVNRAVLRATSKGEVFRRATQVLAGIHLIRLDDQVLSAAAELRPAELRTLDALHLASALSLREDLGTVIAYDDRLVTAARQICLEVLSPR